MESMVEIKHLKGTRDYDPKKAKILYMLYEKANKIFPKYGYDPLDTSTLERWETLISKDVNAGEEIKEQTYNFIDRGGKHIGLRYDLTISLIRYVVENKNIPLPFKRYQLGKVYRYEEAKRSRYREFYQLDLDVVGGKSYMYDAELLKIANKYFEAVDVRNYTILINSRVFLESVLEKWGVKKEQLHEVMRIIDRIDKISKEEFIEMIKKYVGKDATSLYDAVVVQYENANAYQDAFYIKNKDIQDLQNALDMMEVENYAFSMKIVRGLGYYTSNVFETFIRGMEHLGSVASGGRYDNVFDKILKMHLPSVGFSFGIDRILDILYDKVDIESKRVYIAYVGKDVLEEVLRIRESIISLGIETFISYDAKNLTNQIKDAISKGIKHFIIVGKKDLDKGEITYRNLDTGEERKVSLEGLEVLKDVVGRH